MNAFPEKVHGRRPSMKAGTGYTVIRKEGWPGEIKGLACQFCDHFENVANHRRGGDRSGLPRYNRARAAMVKHVFAKHGQQIRAAFERQET